MDGASLWLAIAPSCGDQVKPFVLHDLRRVFASGMQRLGVRLEVTESLLGHVSGTRAGIVGVYQVYRYEDEKREAIRQWEAYLASLGDATSPKISCLLTYAAAPFRSLRLPRPPESADRRPRSPMNGANRRPQLGIKHVAGRPGGSSETSGARSRPTFRA